MPAAPSEPAGPGATGVPSPTSRPAADPPRRPWLLSDGARYLLTVVISTVAAAGYGVLVQTIRPDSIGSLAFIVSVYFGTWSVYALVYSGLTWAVLRTADGASLAAWLTEDRSRRRRRRRVEQLAGSGGPLGALSFCAVATGAVVWAAVLPQLRDDPVVIGLAVLVVAATWLLIATVFAVHYAREDTHLGGLGFSGTEQDGRPRLSDYLYLSVQVSTAYNGADVTATRQHMRRTITAHAVVAFVFNTVLIALLVSLMVTIAM